MTREEAIKILKAIRVYECYPKSASEETKEAIDMAIEALKEKNRSDSLVTDSSDACKESKSKLDLISRQDAIDALAKEMPSLTTPDGSGEFDHDIQITDEAFVDCMQIINELPSAEPQPKPISYIECANAMLKMWIDNVLTDGEYNRIMEKLNSKHMADMRDE